jgi:hypothetical protein
MGKTFRQRVMIMGLLVLVFLVAYGIAKRNSSAIVAYVVEQALLQKAPAGMDLASVKSRFDGTLATLPERDKLLKLLSLSSYLEKVQRLTPAELDRLLPRESLRPGSGF